MGNLKDSLPFLPGENTDHPFWVQGDLTPEGESFKHSMDAPAEIELRYSPNRTRAGDVAKLKAKKFGELLAQGVRPGVAAHQLHTTVQKLMDQPEVQKDVRNLIETFTLDAQVRKLLVRATVNKGILENAKAPQFDPEGKQLDAGGDPKLLVEYLKMAAKDSEIGIDAPPQINNNTFVMDSSLREVLDRTIPVPQLAEPDERT